jgi:hypothetical protein
MTLPSKHPQALLDGHHQGPDAAVGGIWAAVTNAVKNEEIDDRIDTPVAPLSKYFAIYHRCNDRTE